MQYELDFVLAVSCPAITGGNLADESRMSDKNHATTNLMDRILERENMERALRRVISNKGKPGVDGVTVEALKPYLKVHWERIKQELRDGRYRPQPVRRVEIPKPDGGVRLLGIPCAVDRLIQQAVLQVLNPIFDAKFSESSYGFRPGRSAHDAVRAARDHVRAGFTIVVDIDIEKFFDNVNHDILMARVARTLKDKAVLKLLRRYLQAGVLINGVRLVGEEGVPQGGPISPLLANIMLDDLDRELEKRGHRFCRYADDCNIYVRSMGAGRRVKASITKFLEKKLKLRVNPAKSAVDYPRKRKFLGFRILRRKKGGVQIFIAERSIERLKDGIRRLTRARTPISFEERIRRLVVYLRGWAAYFAPGENTAALSKISQWMRHRLRMCLWRQWRLPRTQIRELTNRGLSLRDAFRLVTMARSKGPWRISGTHLMGIAFSPGYFRRLGLLNIEEFCLRSRQGYRTAVYGPVRTVV